MKCFVCDKCGRPAYWESPKLGDPCLDCGGKLRRSDPEPDEADWENEGGA